VPFKIRIITFVLSVVTVIWISVVAEWPLERPSMSHGHVLREGTLTHLRRLSLPLSLSSPG